jgi:ADP-ribose pyrophosphatase
VSFPKVLTRRRTTISPWVDLVEKTVQFGAGRPPETYHCLTQPAYIGVFVQLADRRIPIVRQFRPCVETYTWELPAGTLDPGETPEQAARREVLEETGIRISDAQYLGTFHPDTGRLQIDSHAFYAIAEQAVEPSAGENGLTVKHVTHRELKQMIVSGAFRHQIHLAIYAALRARDIDLD